MAQGTLGSGECDSKRTAGDPVRWAKALGCLAAGVLWSLPAAEVRGQTIQFIPGKISIPCGAQYTIYTVITAEGGQLGAQGSQEFLIRLVEDDVGDDDLARIRGAYPAGSNVASGDGVQVIISFTLECSNDCQKVTVTQVGNLSISIRGGPFTALTLGTDGALLGQPQPGEYNISRLFDDDDGGELELAMEFRLSSDEIGSGAFVCSPSAVLPGQMPPPIPLRRTAAILLGPPQNAVFEELQLNAATEAASDLRNLGYVPTTVVAATGADLQAAMADPDTGAIVFIGHGSSQGLEFEDRFLLWQEIQGFRPEGLPPLDYVILSACSSLVDEEDVFDAFGSPTKLFGGPGFIFGGDSVAATWFWFYFLFPQDPLPDVLNHFGRLGFGGTHDGPYQQIGDPGSVRFDELYSCPPLTTPPGALPPLDQAARTLIEAGDELVLGREIEGLERLRDSVLDFEMAAAAGLPEGVLIADSIVVASRELSLQALMVARIFETIDETVERLVSGGLLETLESGHFEGLVAEVEGDRTGAMDRYIAVSEEVRALLRARDCNSNGVTDAEDIESGLSEDVNANAVPDECEIGSVVWVFDGTAQGGQVSATIEGFFATCTVTIDTFPGQSAEEVAGNFAAAIDTDGCLAAQDITAVAAGGQVTLTGFLMHPSRVTDDITDPGLEHSMPVVTIPTLTPWGLLALAVALVLVAGARRLRERSGRS